MYIEVVKTTIYYIEVASQEEAISLLDNKEELDIKLANDIPAIEETDYQLVNDDFEPIN